MDEECLNNVSQSAKTSFCVQVRNAYKSYPHKGQVLKGLHLSVAEGTIYGLLGPSGCGKTTLLSALIGQLHLDVGEITMSIKKKSELGYMPQDVALYQEFSIKEHAMYYGYLFSMKTQEILKKTKDLLEFLELPDMDCVISQLSGGQQRRVSLCVTLLHDPQLLILDEPTVGVDIVLCNSIWENLVHMASKGKTIIITTHYVEEARRSNMIGLMRNGVILAEGEPNHLLQTNNCDTLEGVFVKLCKRDMDGDDYGHYEETETSVVEKLKQKEYLKSEGILNWFRVWAYLIKNIFWMKRNIPMVLFTLGLPIVQCTLVSLTVGENPVGISIGIVNDELLNEHKQIRLNCYEHPLVECSDSSRLSCFYVKTLKDKGLNIKEYNDMNSAMAAAQQNKIWGIVYINLNYTSSLLLRLAKKNGVNGEILDQSDINVQLDLSNQIIGTFLKQILTKSTIEVIKTICKFCNYSAAGAELPLSYEKPVFGIEDPSFRQFMTPANAILFGFFLPMMFTLGSMLMEKTSGLLQRSLVAGISLLEVAIGHIILQYFVLIIQTLFMMAVLFWIFDNPKEGSTWSCLALLLSIGACGMFYGFFIAAACTSFTTASCLAIGSYFPLFVLSGAIWPVEGMHFILRYISAVLPLTTSVESFRAVSMRNSDLSDPVVYGNIISLTIWSIIFCFCTVVVLRYNGYR